MSISREIVVYSHLPFKKYRRFAYVTISMLGSIVVTLFATPTPMEMAEREAYKLITKSDDKSRLQNLDSEFISEGPSRDDKLAIIGNRQGKLGEIFRISNIIGNITGRPYSSGGLILAGTLVTLGLLFRVRRTVHMITLLPQDMVRISTFSPLALGKPPAVEVPLSYVSCLQPRDAANNYTMIKIRGLMGVHLVDNSDGQFHEPELFDQYLGFSRSWAAR